MSKAVENKSIACVSTKKMVEILFNMYSKVIINNESIKRIPSVMLWGAPGVGKSQGVREFANELERKLNRRVVVTDVRLLLFNPIDLRGIPVADQQKEFAVWLKPKIFNMDPSPECINVLFLDELTAAPPSVQAAAYQIVLDRIIGEHRLPDNCIVIAAGNRASDKSISYTMPKALANRLMHLEIKVDITSWTEWAIQNGINGKIIGFLNFKPAQIIDEDLSVEMLAYASPRTWEFVSNILNYVKDEVNEVFPMIQGIVGFEHANEFKYWAKIYARLPNVEKIFNGTETKTPNKNETSELFALIGAMSEYAAKHKNDLNKITNSIIYADNFPLDFQALLFRNYSFIEDNYKEKLLGIPEYTDWLRKRGQTLNGII